MLRRVCFILLMSAAQFVLTSPVSAQSAISCHLKASWEPWPPYQFKDKNGALSGLDNELILRIARAAGCKITLVEVPWKRALTMLRTGKLDVTAGASYSQDRNVEFLFSTPYRTESIALFVHQARTKPYNFTQLENLANSNFIFGIVRGYFYGETFNKLKVSGQLAGQTTETLSDEQNFRKLLTGRISGVLADTFVGSDIIIRNRMQKEVKRMPTLIHQSDIHFIFSRKIQDGRNLRLIRDQFNQAIEQLTQSGELNEITQRYLH